MGVATSDRSRSQAHPRPLPRHRLQSCATPTPDLPARGREKKGTPHGGTDRLARCAQPGVQSCRCRARPGNPDFLRLSARRCSRNGLDCRVGPGNDRRGRPIAMTKLIASDAGCCGHRPDSLPLAGRVGWGSGREIAAGPKRTLGPCPGTLASPAPPPPRTSPQGGGRRRGHRTVGRAEEHVFS